MKIVLGPFLRLLWRPDARGVEHVPEDGPAILAGNHVSFSDSVFMPLVLPRRVRFIAKAEYFTEKGVKGWLKRNTLTGIGSIPVDRSGGDEATRALLAAQRVVENGELFGIYPEGTRSPDGRLYKGKTGVARLALTTGAPVVPVAMLNTGELQPIGRKFPRIGRVRLVFGEPLDFSRYSAHSYDRAFERAVTDEIMDAIRGLSGQEYVDSYAADVKSRSDDALG